jgi:hypothetical protein
MKLLIKVLMLLSLSLTAISCFQNKSKWNKGAIVEQGVYETSNIRIKVEISNDRVDFKGFDQAGKILLQNPHAFSALHRWALYLDKEESLWVFSSDIGHYIFRKDLATGEYEYSQFSHFLKRNEIPEYIYNDLKSFVSFH